MPTTTGQIGEDLACRYLVERGCVIADRNVYVGADEIDILAHDHGVVAAIEVKAAAGHRDPRMAFDDDKMARLRRAAGAVDRSVHRLDLLTVQFGRAHATIRWFKGIR